MNNVTVQLKQALVQLRKSTDSSAIIPLLENLLKQLPTHVACYHHSNGDDLYLIRCECDEGPTEDDLVSALKLNFEPNGEWISIESVAPVILLAKENDEAGQKRKS